MRESAVGIAMEKHVIASRWEAGMRQLSGWRSAVFALMAMWMLGGCGTAQAPINRVGTNVVEKTAFTGSWYMVQTLIDFEYEAASMGFVGEVSADPTGGAYSGGMARIRWVIDQNFLLAYRDYQTVGEATDPYAEANSDFLGQPVAAYRITSHFDIRRDYNTTTGEELNVIVENSTDRRWWERRFMRVDWSQNLISGWYGVSTDLAEIFGSVRREPAAITPQPGSDYPVEWLPRFDRMSCSSADDTSAGCRENDRIWAGDYAQNDLYHMTFVTQQLLTPSVTNPSAEWTSVAVAIRTSFLRRSETRQYQGEAFRDNLFDRAGYFRLERDTFDGSSEADDISFGMTDYRNVSISRHNLWQNWYTQNADGTRTPTNIGERRVRQLHWYTSRELPAHLVRPAFQTASEWNVNYMTLVRHIQGRALPVGPDGGFDCQEENPDGFCFCQRAEDGTLINPTCDYVYDPFETPAQVAARGVSDPFDCHVEIPAGAEPDLQNDAARVVDLDITDAAPDFEGWFGARMVGSECVNVLHINSCNIAAVARNGGTTEGIDCQERGDARFNLLSYVDTPGTPFLGVAQFRADPVSGELLGTDANIGGPALQTVRVRAMQAWDLVTGRITEQQFFTGEDIRAFLESSNHIDLPAPPRIDFSVASSFGESLPGGAGIGEFQGVMDAAMDRTSTLRGRNARANTFIDRVEALRDTGIERQLVASDDALALAGISEFADGFDRNSQSFVDAASPVNGQLMQRMVDRQEFETRLSAHGMHMVNEYTDNSVLWFVNQHRDWPRARVEFELNRRLYRQTELHEMGHCMGLRHDFGGSADSGNYSRNYYVINERFPLPRPSTFDRDGDAGLSAVEQQQFEDAYVAARRRRELAGIDAEMSSSIMEYTGQWYERIQGLGFHDAMALSLGYAGLVDAYHNVDGRPVSQINPSTTDRVYARYYQGGERCEADADCPFNDGGARASELTPANLDGNLVQRCAASATGSTRRVCSNFDVDARAVLSSTTATSTPEYLPISYRYCEDLASLWLPWCSRFDEGDNFRDIVRNAFESYDRNYIFAAFRRYRRTYDIGTYADYLFRAFGPLVKIQQDLMYRYASDPSYRATSGSWQFDDQFLAAADALNFFARVMGNTDVGSYRWDAGYQRYERDNPDPMAQGADLRVPLGTGRYSFTIYQAGLTGINRIERVGAFYDQIYAMLYLTMRGGQTFDGSSASYIYGTDVPFLVNFYDLFPNEMNQILSGIIADQPAEYMPRLACSSLTANRCNDPRLVYMDFYRGDCSPGAPVDACRPNPTNVYQDLRVVNGGGAGILPNYAAIFGLQSIPISSDMTFASQVFLCVEGQGDCQTPPPDAIEGLDYVRHTSARFNQSYLAWQLEPTASRIEERSVSFNMVQEARDTAFILQALRDIRGDFGDPPNDPNNISQADRDRLAALNYTVPTSATVLNNEIDRLDSRVISLESFFNFLIEIERRTFPTLQQPWVRT